jgi:hypothetical protein
MLLDRLNQFCNATAIGGATGRRLLGDVIDQNAGKTAPVLQDLGNSSDELWFVVEVAVAFTSGGAGTLQLEFVSDAQAAIAVDGTATEHFTSEVFALAALTVGARLVAIKVPAGDYERFLGVIGNVGTAAMTAGSLNAYFTKGPGGYAVGGNKFYPDAVN